MHCGRRAFTRHVRQHFAASSLASILAWTRSRCLPRVGRRSYFFETISNAVKRLDHVELNVACPAAHAPRASPRSGIGPSFRASHRSNGRRACGLHRTPPNPSPLCRASPVTPHCPSISCRCRRDGFSGIDERFRFQAGCAISRASVQRQRSFGQGPLLERRTQRVPKRSCSLGARSAKPAALRIF
jgi:hypothetical protein